MPMTEEQLKALPQHIRGLYAELERRIVERICTRIGDIGELTGSDLRQLERLSDIGADVDSILKDIASTTKLAEEKVYTVFNEAARADYDFQKQVYDKLGKQWVPFDSNPNMTRLVESISKITAGEITNFTKTTGFIGDVTGTKAVPRGWAPIAEYYQDTVDFATWQIRNGATDYHSAMRQSVKLLSDNGLRFIEYDNANKKYYRRRVDSSVSNAINGGLQRLSREQAELIGAEIGADGMEISAHTGARETHQWFQGLQFPMEEYHKDVEALLDDYNCYHRAFPVIIGVSRPAHSKQDLADLREDDARRRTYGDKSYNQREAQDKQRKIETAIRKQKDRAKAFAATGDKDAERQALLKASGLNGKYNEFSAAMGLTARDNRKTVVDLSRSQAARMGAMTRKQNAVSALTGTVTSNGITNTPSKHLWEQAIDRKIKVSDIHEALTNPIHIGSLRTDGSCQYIGREATVAVGIADGKVRTVWRTGSGKRKKYGGGE